MVLCTSYVNKELTFLKTSYEPSTSLVSHVIYHLLAREEYHSHFIYEEPGACSGDELYN